ncbi:MAG: NUDIX domain-containing protein [Gaiellaceae bacterium]
MESTWDGLPVAREPPYAACVVVWRRAPHGREFLVLHRLHAGGPDHEGDWAWTPPAGARLPGESPEVTAARELLEETGLELSVEPAADAAPSADVAHYVAECPAGETVVLDGEHDRFAWVTLEEAVARCLPPDVGTGIAKVAARLDTHDADGAAGYA